MEEWGLRYGSSRPVSRGSEQGNDADKPFLASLARWEELGRGISEDRGAKRDGITLALHAGTCARPPGRKSPRRRRLKGSVRTAKQQGAPATCTHPRLRVPGATRRHGNTRTRTYVDADTQAHDTRVIDRVRKAGKRRHAGTHGPRPRGDARFGFWKEGTDTHRHTRTHAHTRPSTTDGNPSRATTQKSAADLVSSLNQKPPPGQPNEGARR